MQSTTNRKETIMKATLSTGYFRLAAVLAVAAPLAIVCGNNCWG
jgi:hypothetical protein